MDSHADTGIKHEAFPLAHAIQTLPALINLLPPILIYLGGVLRPLVALAGFVPRHHSHLIMRCGKRIVILRRSLESSTAR